MADEEKALDSMLDKYTVADADEFLLERIVARARTRPIARRSRSAWFIGASVLTAAAVTGFLIGFSTWQQTQYSNTANLDNYITGVSTLEEVRL